MPLIGNAFVFTVLDSFRRTDSQSWFRYIRSENDEKNWSSKFLRDQFKERGFEYLFDKYRSRIQQSTFTLALMIIIVFSVVRLITIFTIDKVDNVYRPSAIMYGFAILLCVVLLIFVCVHTVDWRWRLVHYFMSIVVLIVLLAADYIYIFYNWKDSHSPRLSPTFIVILITYIFLPFPHYYGAVVAGTLVSLLELLISGFIFYSGISEIYGEQYSIYPLAADCIFLVACNGVGVYKLYIDEVNQRRAFLDRRMCIESQIKCIFEEEREDRLLSTVLPRHIITNVKRDIRSGILNADMKPTNHWPFSELYVAQYENVSVMFADIVNFTKLASHLTSENLVILLDDLFGRFDAIAEKHSCMRIRIVGDCYIATCGLPNYISNHATNCTEMGFEMIEAIKEIREERRLNIDMRIGIHCGKVIGGILGVRKWQFDIWSQDVEIANLMEHTGQSGRIHISNVVRDLLRDHYKYEQGFGEQKSEFLSNKGIKTYLIIPVINVGACSINENFGVTSPDPRRISIYQPNISHVKRQINFKRLLSISLVNGNYPKSSRESGVFNYMYRDIMTDLISNGVNSEMEKAIDDMALRKRDQWTKVTGIDPLTLRFIVTDSELPYMRQIDPLYKYYLLAVLLIFLAFFAINCLAITTSDIYSSVPYVVLVVPLMALVYVAWHDYVVNVKMDSSEDPQTPKNKCNSYLTSVSRNVASSLKMRIILWLTTASVLTILSICNLSMCLFCNHLSCKTDEGKIEDTRYFTYSFALAITSVAVFLRIYHLYKLIAYVTLMVIFFSFYGFYVDDFVFESFFPGEFIPCVFPADHCVYIIFIIVCHHLMDRQFEYLSRLDYLWKCQLREKQEEINVTNTANKFLIHNMFPHHVALYYMNEGTKNKIYHEEYTHVAVMFASIPNFSDFYEETDLNGHGLKCLQLLNEIICELDCLLSVPEFSRVEKIKVISSTYMCAAGLKPSRRFSDDDTDHLDPVDIETNVTTLVNLAFEMMQNLERLNQNALQEFRFRIGIEYGCISAGVVGAKKPLYDIWGDTVNIASRMESNGVVGRIQVTEKVASVLRASGYKCNCRGNIRVKGKDRELVTYLLTSRPSSQLVVNDERIGDLDYETTYL